VGDDLFAERRVDVVHHDDHRAPLPSGFCPSPIALDMAVDAVQPTAPFIRCMTVSSLVGVPRWAFDVL
jgi:hypothetical protein